MSLELAQPRVFSFEDRKRNFSVTCKTLTKQMWLKYFSSIISSSEIVDGNTETSYDSTGARLQLLADAAIDCDGYGLSDGEKAENAWQNSLPLKHRRAIADMLVDVETVELGDDEMPAFGLEAIALKAVWTSGENGRMQAVTGLKHLFGSPTAKQQTRFSRSMSRSVIIGGSRTGQTRYLGGQDVHIELYDELVQSVEGYVLNGEPLNNRTELIVASMDSYHKVAAVNALFTPINVKVG